MLIALTRQDLTVDFASILSTNVGTAPAPFTVFAPTDQAFIDLSIDEIKNAIENKDGEKLMKIFSSTKKVRKEIIKAGQDTEKPGFGRK